MKKFLKIIAIIFTSILSLTLIFVSYIFISNKSFLESKNESNVAYLEKNQTQIIETINEDLFDKNFYESKVFLFGESHGYADNQKLDKQLFLFLNKKLGIKYYIAEIDSLTAKKLNNYLSSDIKNDSVLKDFVRAVKIRMPQQSSQELFYKWSELYDYNKNLPDSLKITVLGIDKNFDDYSKVSRDSAMENNFNNSLKNLKIENENFYGLFGFYHVLQNKVELGSETFAARLKKAGNKITSFVSYTIDSEMYLPKNPQFPNPPNEKIGLFNSDGPLVLVKGINDIKELSNPNAVTLFKINSQNSPYFKSQNLMNIKSRVDGQDIIAEKGTHTTDYFQYVFLLRNSKALSKLK